MIEPLEHAYFNWLYAKVCDVRSTSKSKQFEILLQELHRTEFTWIVTGDDNRAEDGRDLREEFYEMSTVDADEDWFNEGCSVLEMLIALARRAAFETGESTEKWFWLMLENLGLSKLSDNKKPNRDAIKNTLEIFVWRMYDELGHGGIFPLRETEYDQRYVELWYQLSEYLWQNNIA